MIKDTMIPTKPEDYEVAIPQDKNQLKKEVEEMINDSIPFWLEKNKQLQRENKTETVKCTCAKQFFTKKRNRKKGLIVMKRQTNGYTNQGCPVHFHK